MYVVMKFLILLNTLPLIIQMKYVLVAIISVSVSTTPMAII